MTIARTAPPKSPVIIQSTVGTDPTTWNLTTATSGVTFIAPVAQSSVRSTVKSTLLAASVDPSALVTILSPSGNPLLSAQLSDF